MNKEVAGYQITDFISVEGQHYVLGHHPSPNCPSPYATWQTNEEMDQFWWGHYFGDKAPAIADMVQRATYALERPDGIPLAVDFLSDSARESLKWQIRDEFATEDIKAALEEVLSDDELYPTALSAEEILKNPDFAARAMHNYDNVDHSEENYALRNALEDILDNHPEFLHGVEAQHAEAEIPLEQPSRKPTLGQMISDASDKASKESHDPVGKEPVR